MRTQSIRNALALVLAGVVLSAASAVYAQGQLEKLKSTTPEERAKVQTAMMTERLDLTADQKPKIAAINMKYAERMQPVLQGSEGPLMKMHAVKEMSAQKEAELKQVLTSAQFEKYLASKEEMRQKFEAKMAEHVKGGGM